MPIAKAAPPARRLSLENAVSQKTRISTPTAESVSGTKSGRSCDHLVLLARSGNIRSFDRCLVTRDSGGRAWSGLANIEERVVRIGCHHRWWRPYLYSCSSLDAPSGYSVKVMTCTGGLASDRYLASCRGALARDTGTYEAECGHKRSFEIGIRIVDNFPPQRHSDPARQIKVE